MAEPYTLPDLPYDYGALEPYLSGEIMELHHGTHHAGYVKGANTALDQLADSREHSRYDTARMVEKDLAFHLSGHVNHSVFWQNLSPQGGDKPDGVLATAIDSDFGSFDAFRAHFTAAALQVQGSGWTALTFHSMGQPTGGRLLITQIYDHQSNVVHGGCPLLLLDMWEHAYYLQYRTGKIEYVEAFWHVVSWADVAARYLAAAEQPHALP